MKYYFTFMLNQKALKDYYVEIEAPDSASAREEMELNFGLNWAFQYTKKPEDRNASKGCLLSIKCETINF